MDKRDEYGLKNGEALIVVRTAEGSYISQITTWDKLGAEARIVQESAARALGREMASVA